MKAGLTLAAVATTVLGSASECERGYFGMVGYTDGEYPYFADLKACSGRKFSTTYMDANPNVDNQEIGSWLACGKSDDALLEDDVVMLKYYGDFTCKDRDTLINETIFGYIGDINANMSDGTPYEMGTIIFDADTIVCPGASTVGFVQCTVEQNTIYSDDLTCAGTEIGRQKEQFSTRACVGGNMMYNCTSSGYDVMLYSGEDCTGSVATRSVEDGCGYYFEPNANMTGFEDVTFLQVERKIKFCGACEVTAVASALFAAVFAAFNM